jgi:hypothetical protein
VIPCAGFCLDRMVRVSSHAAAQLLAGKGQPGKAGKAGFGLSGTVVRSVVLRLMWLYSTTQQG